MQSWSTFIRMSGPIPEVKNPTLINDYENIIAYSKESEQSEVLGKQVWFVPNTFGGLRVSLTSGKCGHFYFHLSLETIFPALKLTLNCYINISVSFS